MLELNSLGTAKSIISRIEAMHIVKKRQLILLTRLSKTIEVHPPTI
jgi:hypothetical protein